MARLTLTASSTFWFALENRHVPIGGQFTIEDKDFPFYEKVARDVVSGKIPDFSRKPTFTDRIVTKATGVVLGLKDLVGGGTPTTEDSAGGAAPVDAAPAGGSVECEICKQRFKTQAGLDLHNKNAHKPKDTSK